MSYVGLSLRSVPPISLPRPEIVAEVTRHDWHKLASSDGWLARLHPATPDNMRRYTGLDADAAKIAKLRFAREFIEPHRQFLSAAVGQSDCEAALLVAWDVPKLPDGVYQCRTFLAPFSVRNKAAVREYGGRGGNYFFIVLDNEIMELLPTMAQVDHAVARFDKE